MKAKLFGWGIAAVGVALAAAGLWLAKTFPEAAGPMAALPYVLIGLGCGAFGHGVGALANAAAFRKHPDLAREKAIEEKDERNVAIFNRAKAKALDRMFYVFGALMVSLALMGVDIGVVLLLVAAYLFVAGCMVYYMCKYQKEMRAFQTAFSRRKTSRGACHRMFFTVQGDTAYSIRR